MCTIHRVVLSSVIVVSISGVLKARVELAYYEAGHMMYIRPSEHRKLKQDVARFIKAASSSAQR